MRRLVRWGLLVLAVVLAGWMGVQLVPGSLSWAAEPPGSSASQPEPVDINSATPEELKTLPGLTEGDILRIMGSRPFQQTDQLVTEKILTQEAYDKIKDRIVARGTKPKKR